jgi:hypothetical protein
MAEQDAYLKNYKIITQRLSINFLASPTGLTIITQLNHCAMATAKCKWNYQIKAQECNHQKYGSEHCFGYSWYYSNENDTLLPVVQVAHTISTGLLDYSVAIRRRLKLQK